MHMKREASKRRQPLVRTAVYSLMTLSVVAIVTVLMLIVLGYSFNQKDGRFEQGGLLQFSSTPSGATITLDEVKLGSQTTTKANVESGNHSVSYDLEGYKTWKKAITILPGQIGWLSYARLIPKSLTPQTLRSFTTLSSTLASPQHNYMVLHEAADQPVFVLANIQDDTTKYSDLQLSAGSYTAPSAGKTQSFTMESWSSNEQSILVKHVYNTDKIEWILLDREEPEKSVNISTAFGVLPDRLIFAGGGDRMLFAQTGDIVRRINLDDQTLSRPLVSQVDYFKAYDDKTIIYSTTPNDKALRTVGYASVDIAVPQTIGTYPADGKLLRADMGSYFNKRYVAIVHGPKVTIFSGTLPKPDEKGSLKIFKSQTVPENTTGIAMSRNGRFVVTSLADGYATYDIELLKYDRTTWAVPSTVQRELQWLDDYTLWSDNGGQIRFYEFDGANQNNIMTVTEGFSASRSPNNKFFYSINKIGKGFDLRRVQLIL